MSSRDRAMAARSMYRAGRIGRSEAAEMMADYAREFNGKSRELACKYGVRPKLFSFEAFCR